MILDFQNVKGQNRTLSASKTNIYEIAKNFLFIYNLMSAKREIILTVQTAVHNISTLSSIEVIMFNLNSNKNKHPCSFELKFYFKQSVENLTCSNTLLQTGLYSLEQT